MTTTIALAGKGGTGKTTIAALLIRYLCEEHNGSILAIDADPSSNLNMVLGMEVEQTVGDIREGMLTLVQSSGALAGSMPGGMSKHEYLDYQIQMALEEGERVDLLAMGRPEGPGCYCAANQMLRVILDRIAANYDYVVIDNEAGMEHLSRRTTRNVDVLLLVTDPTQRGLIAAQHMREMVPELNIGVGQVYLIVNRLRGGSGGVGGCGSVGAGRLPLPLAEAVARTGLELLGTVPEDAAMAEFEFTGRPLVELPAETAVYRAVREIAERVVG
ncbi:MAG: AAA family ATPase [Anaerolineae bacterium]|nr:AAA family ATPase [Anaerolineae bacterium]